MKVAWQFTSWNAFTKKTRPVLSAIARMATEEGHALSWSAGRFAFKIEERFFRPNHTVPYGTGSLSCIPWQ
jgi:hypothetical protein